MSEKGKEHQYEAHVQFELKALSGKILKQNVQEEIRALFEWFRMVRVEDLVSSQLVWDAVRRNVIERPVTDEVTDLLSSCALEVREIMLKTDDTRLDTILSQDRYEQWVAEVFEMHDLRNEVIHQLVSSTVFARLTSDTLYEGIKAFMLSDNLVMKNIPGASSLVSAGKDWLNRRTFGLAGNIAGQLDRQIKKFVSANIKEQLKLSETMLIEAFDAKMFKKTGHELWSRLLAYDAADAAGYISPERIQALSPLVRDFWLDFRKSAIFERICRGIIDHLFEKYGGEPVERLLADIGINEKDVTAEAMALVLPVLKTHALQEYLETRVRAHLSKFYFGETASQPARKSAKTARKKSSAGKRKETRPADDDTDRVLDCIRNTTEGVTGKAIQEQTGLDAKTVQTAVRKLKSQDKIATVRRGVYIGVD